jgi:CheY-like chemotaxis protein
MTRPLRPRTLLIIDDNVTNLRVAVEHLKAYSYEILTASNGEVRLECERLALAEWALDPAVVETELKKGEALDWDETVKELLEK